MVLGGGAVPHERGTPVADTGILFARLKSTAVDEMRARMFYMDRFRESACGCSAVRGMGLLSRKPGKHPDAGLCCGSRLRKGEVFASVGRNQNLKDLKAGQGRG